MRLRTLDSCLLHASLVDAPGVGVDVEAGSAQEADQGNIAGQRHIYRQAAGRGDGGDQRDARRQRFQDDLEGKPPADEQHAIRQRQLPI